MIFPDSLALAQARADYERDGVACLRNIVDPIWIERLRDGTAQARADLSEYSVDLSAADPGEDAAATQKRAFWGDFSLWQRFDPFERFILDSPIGAVTAAAVGSERIRLFYDYLLVKEALPGTKTPWHQDFPYYPVMGDAICSMWVALDRTTLENGGLEYVAGSHTWGMRLDRKSFAGVKSKFTAEEQAEIDSFEAGIAELPDIEAERDRLRILSWDLEPGDVLIHHAMTVHGAPANNASTQRRGYAIRWMYDDILYAPRVNPSRHLRAIIEGGEPSVAGGEVIRGSNFPEFTGPSRKST